MTTSQPASGGAQPPDFLLLGLDEYADFDEDKGTLMETIIDEFEFGRAVSVEQILDYLESTTPKVIVVIDPLLMLEFYEQALEKVLAYLRGGGLVIFGFGFTMDLAEENHLNKFFANFNVDWKFSRQKRMPYQFNYISNNLPDSVTRSSFPFDYEMEAVVVENARPIEEIFVARQIVHQRDATGHVDTSQAAVVGAPFGDGYFVYIGDLHGEHGTQRLLMGLCGKKLYES